MRAFGVNAQNLSAGMPLFTNIPQSNVVIDNLHVLLRVADVLIDHLVVELRRRNGIEKQSGFN